jgi:hypothetical protein
VSPASLLPPLTLLLLLSLSLTVLSLLFAAMSS